MKRWVICLAMLMLMVSCVRAEKTVRITFTGDVTLGSEEHLWQEETSFISYAQEYGYDYFFENVRSLFEADDLTVVNLEGVLSDSSEGENTKKTYRFRGPAEFAQILSNSSVELANLANNHTMDYGERGYLDTRAALDAVGVEYLRMGKAETID